MPLVLRSTKGSELSFSEMDGNFTFLENLAEISGATGATTGALALASWLNVHLSAFLQPAAEKKNAHGFKLFGRSSDALKSLYFRFLLSSVAIISAIMFEPNN